MSISRRDFFVEAFGMAAKQVHKVVPPGIHGLLGIEKNKPMSADEAAFELASRRRKKTPPVSLTPNNIADNISSDLKNKSDTDKNNV